MGGACVNTVGSYYCSCPPQLLLDETQRNCVNSSHLTLGKPWGDSKEDAPPGGQHTQHDKRDVSFSLLSDPSVSRPSCVCCR